MDPDGVISGTSSGAGPGEVRLHSPLLHPLLRPPNNHNRHLGEVVELIRGLILEVILEVGDAPTQPTGGGSPSRSLPHLVAREQAAPFPVHEPARPGGKVELSHQRPCRSLTRRPGRNSETRQLYSSRKAVSFPGGLEQDHHR